VQLGLMLAVGGVAACASWSHVLDLARAHGQAGWLAWAVAACTETAAVSAGLEVRRRRRAGAPIGLPVLVLVLATVLQLAAQVAQAERTAWGVVLSAVPAVTFLVLVELALSRGAAVEVSPARSAKAPARSARPTARPVDPIEVRPIEATPGRLTPVPSIESGTTGRVEPRSSAGRSGGSVEPIEAVRSRLRAAIEAGDLPAAPSAEAIRRHLRVGPTRARSLRDELAQSA